MNEFLGNLTERGRSEAILLADERACLILVIDQFEEVLQAQFISRQERDEFFKLLVSLARTGRIWVLATIRADFWGRALELPSLAAFGFDPAPPPNLSSRVGTLGPRKFCGDLMGMALRTAPCNSGDSSSRLSCGKVGKAQIFTSARG